VNGYFRGYEPFDVVIQVVFGVAVLFILQILLFTPDLKRKILQKGFQGLKIVPGVQGTIDKEKGKVRTMIYEKFNIKDQPKHLSIPETAISKEEIITRLQAMQANDEKHWKSGKVSGAVYDGTDEHTEFMGRVYTMFCLSNALHPDVFQSTRKFEAEIVQMTADMVLGGPGVCGSLTSGGTESILMAVKAYRDRAGISNPEMIAPISVHAAFDKAAKYFGIKLIHVPLDSSYRADVKAIERAITKNTIMIAGSAPNYPYGTIDPIPEMAALAMKHGIGFHTDACLGGYLLPWLKKAGISQITNFDFSVPGVTSMSIDTHKYGYTTKGTSVVLFGSEDLRRHMYFVQPDWPGGMYASPTMAGSRSGGVIACCYASLLSTGKDGYTKKSLAIYQAAQEIKEGIRKGIPELTLIGDSHSSVVAFRSELFDIYKVGDVMSKKGWSLNSLQKPSSLHVCVTYPLTKMAKTLVQDLKDAVKFIIDNPKGVPDGLAPIYGMAANFPDRGTISEVGQAYLDAVLMP